MNDIKTTDQALSINNPKLLQEEVNKAKAMYAEYIEIVSENEQCNNRINKLKSKIKERKQLKPYIIKGLIVGILVSIIVCTIVFLLCIRVYDNMHALPLDRDSILILDDSAIQERVMKKRKFNDTIDSLYLPSIFILFGIIMTFFVKNGKNKTTKENAEIDKENKAIQYEIEQIKNEIKKPVVENTTIIPTKYISKELLDYMQELIDTGRATSASQLLEQVEKKTFQQEMKARVDEAIAEASSASSAARSAEVAANRAAEEARRYRPY